MTVKEKRKKEKNFEGNLQLHSPFCTYVNFHENSNFPSNDISSIYEKTIERVGLRTIALKKRLFNNNEEKQQRPIFNLVS